MKDLLLEIGKSYIIHDFIIKASRSFSQTVHMSLELEILIRNSFRHIPLMDDAEIIFRDLLDF